MAEVTDENGTWEVSVSTAGVKVSALKAATPSFRAELDAKLAEDAPEILRLEQDALIQEYMQANYVPRPDAIAALIASGDLPPDYTEV